MSSKRTEKASEFNEAVSEPTAVRISQNLVSVYSKPKGGTLGCQLRKGVYVEIKTRMMCDGILWLQIPCGWIASVDVEQNHTYEELHDINQAVLSWEEEDNKRKRMASAIACELVKSHTLVKVRRLVGSLTKHAQAFYPSKPMLNISKVGMEDIMISLGGQLGLSKQKLFEYIKISASQQSNPPQAVLDIIGEINHLIAFRPTQWVVHDLNVLETEDVRRRNDRFVMLAASGKLEEFQEMVEGGHELTCLHSELKYTALHSAADFGQLDIVKYIISTGVSLDMRDPRKQQTALHMAAYNGREHVIRALLAANADRTIGDFHGVRPYQYADMQGLFDCRELLKFLPPTVTELVVADATISTITVTWKCPVINPSIHSEITEYFVDCLPADVTAEEERQLAPVPTTPALPPFPISPSKQRIMKVEYIYQKFLDVTVTIALFSNLTPSTVYRLRAKAGSVSGWSEFCPGIEHKTTCYMPDAPEPVDICKVSTNGLLLSWRPPPRDNGLAVDFYQIELLDAKMATTIAGERQANGSTIVEDEGEATGASQMGKKTPKKVTLELQSTLPLLSPGTAHLHAKRLPIITTSSVSTENSSASTLAGKTSVASRFHRLIKHKNLQYLHKYLTGLEPLRLYQCRVRAHNSLGFSPWSGWTGPIAPQVGVSIAAFTPECLSVTLTWFQPLLSAPTRSVEAYEFQMCCLRGPLTKSVEVRNRDDVGGGGPAEDNTNTVTLSTRRRSGSESSVDSVDSLAWVPLPADDGEEKEPDFSNTNKIKTAKTAQADDANEYITLRSDLTQNTYEVTGLKAGSRYRCRVRSKISDYPGWNPWEFSVLSDIFSMPATPPDPPFMVRAAVGRNFSSAATISTSPAAETSATMLGGTAEFLPCDHESAVTLSAATGSRNSIFDYSLADLLALGKAEDAAAREAVLAERRRTHSSDIVYDENGDIVPATEPDPEAPLNVPDTLLPILLDTAKIGQRLNEKVVRVSPVSRNVSMVQPAVALVPAETAEEPEEEVQSLDGRSMSVIMQSVTSSDIARQTDVDIKSGIYQPFSAARGEAGLKGSVAPTAESALSLGASAPLEITHDSITITWQSGQANGLPVEEFIVEIARVRTYRLVDVVRAREAYSNTNTNDEVCDDENLSGMFKQGFQSRLMNAERNTSAEVTGEDCWQWQDITETGGVFVDFQKFRAEKLIPGSTYIFRVKQRNACGWSAYSGASRMIATYPSVPPGKPAVFAVRSTYVAVRWTESEHPGVGLTNLEYEVQIGAISNILSSDARNSVSQQEFTDPLWRPIAARFLPANDSSLQQLLQEANNDNLGLTSNASSVRSLEEVADMSYVHVLLQSLVSQNTYVLRVRVRTVVGWSPWSATSLPFRMQA